MTDSSAIQWRLVCCPLCGADRSRPLIDDRVRVAGSVYVFHVVRCRECRMIYVNPRGKGKVLSNTEGGSARRDAARANAPIYRGGLDALERAGLRPGAGILDVGCARGDFLAYAQARGYRVAGVDLNPSFAAEARARGFDVQTGDLRAAGDRARQDTVTMWDVIEHVDSPVAVLAACREALVPGGLILFHTGNAPFQIGKARVMSWLRPGRSHLVPQQHLTHFDPGTAFAALQSAGLDPVEAFFAGTLHYREPWKRIAMRVVNAIGKAPRRLGGPLLTNAIGIVGRYDAGGTT